MLGWPPGWGTLVPLAPLLKPVEDSWPGEWVDVELESFIAAKPQGTKP